MRSYIFKRILSMIPLLIGITLITFFIVHLAPGDPTSLLVGPNLTRSDQAQIINNLGLNQPIIVQYLKWLKGIMKFDFGISFHSGRKVSEIILEKLPATLFLSGVGMVISIFSAVFLGILSATRRWTWVDYLISLFTYGGLSIPVFWLGLILILFFSVKLDWLPATGMYSLRLERVTFWNRLYHLVLPLICVVTPGLAKWTRYMRSSMLEVIQQDYMITARAKGLHEKVVIFKHALRNAFIPMITLIGLSLPFVVEGTFIVESIFGWPGMGLAGINGIWQRDYPLIMGINTLTAILILVSNLLTDIFYTVFDPRIRYN